MAKLLSLLTHGWVGSLRYVYLWFFRIMLHQDRQTTLHCKLCIGCTEQGSSTLTKDTWQWVMQSMLGSSPRFEPQIFHQAGCICFFWHTLSVEWDWLLFSGILVVLQLHSTAQFRTCKDIGSRKIHLTSRPTEAIQAISEVHEPTQWILCNLAAWTPWQTCFITLK